MKTTKRFLSIFMAMLMVAGMFAQIALFSHAEAVEISNYGGYKTIIREKSDGSILFSPSLTEVQTDISNGATVNQFKCKLTFTLLSGSNGQELYSFPTTDYLDIYNGNSTSYKDIYLNGSKGNSGFCPTAGKYYKIYVEVYKDNELFCYGTYESVQAPDAIALKGSSPNSYYVPTRVEKPITLPYPGKGYTYNGIRKKSSGQILFSPYIYELRQLIEAGDSYSNYSAKLTFSLVENGEVTATWDPVTAGFLNGNGYYSDIVLQALGVDCGFCPTAGATYNVYAEVYKSDLLLFYGTYENVLAASAIADSTYYDPSAIPSESFWLSETTAGYTGTVYPGNAFAADNSGVYFTAYMTEFRAAIDGGEDVGDYTATLKISKMKDGAEIIAFPTILGAEIEDGGSYFKVVLKDADVSLFCPEAGKTYTVALELLKNGTKVYYGTYTNAAADEGLSTSLFYEPVTGVKQITNYSVYGETLRVKGNGSLVFSPFLDELTAEVDEGIPLSEFTVSMTFTLLSGSNGTVEYVFPATTPQAPNRSNWFYDLYLIGGNGDFGFCPTSGCFYNIYVAIFRRGELYIEGTYSNLQTPSSYEGSSYYRPTPNPNAPITYTMTLAYDFFNDLKGSAAGVISVESDGSGYHEICWVDADGEKLTATVGTKTLTYTPLTSFTLSDSVQSVKHVVLNFTAIPQGAKKLGAFNVNGTPVASIDLPASKLLEPEAYTYSFGIASDIHYNYFHSVDGVDDAVKALNSAISFFEDAGASLLTAVGDYSKYAEEESYQAYAAALANTDLLVLACGGNHELYASINDMYGENGLWRTNMNPGVYDATPIQGVLNVAPNGIDFVYEIPGKTDSVFVFLSQWYWDGHTSAQQHLVTPEQIEWLEEQFETYADRTVFFYFHTYLFDDDGETFDGEGDLTGPAGYTYNAGYNMATPDEAQLRNLLKQYKNVLFFNGHSHYLYEMQKYNPNLNIYDYEGTTATMIHVPSLTNPRLVTDTSSSSYSSTNGSRSQAALMFVYDGYEIMNGLNVWDDEILTEACYIIYNDKTDIVETETSGDVTMIYDEQGQTLRFEGEGEIPAALITAAASYASVVKNVYVCKGITAIPASAFSGFTALTRAEIKETVVSIGENAFAGCASLEKFVYGGSAEDFAQIAIGSGNGALTGAARSYDQFKVTWVIEGETTTEQYRHYKVPTYQGKPSKVSADGTKVYSFTGWTNGTSTYNAGEDLPKVTGNATYTAQFSSTATDRYVSGTLTGNTSITWTLDRYTGELVVTGTGVMDNFTRYNTENPTPAPWRAYVTDITSVYVGGGITQIGAYAFADLTALRSVICGVSVTILSSDSFSYNSALSSIAFHAPITSIGQGTVYSSGNVKYVGLVGQTAESFMTLASARPYNDNYGAATFTVHTLTDIAAVPAACTEAGATAGYFCTDCCRIVGGVDPVPAAGHSFGEWSVTTEATYQTEGVETHVCSVCGETETRPVAKLYYPDYQVTVDETTGEPVLPEGVTNFDSLYIPASVEEPEALLAGLTVKNLILKTEEPTAALISAIETLGEREPVTVFYNKPAEGTDQLEAAFAENETVTLRNLLEISDEAVLSTVEENGETKNVVTFIGAIAKKDLAYDGLTMHLSFYQDGVKLNKDKNVEFKYVYTTIKGVAATNVQTAAAQGLLDMSDSAYLFALSVKGIASGSYTVKISVTAQSGGAFLCTSEEQEIDFTVA